MDMVSAHLHLVRPVVLGLTGRLDPELIAVGYFELVLAAAEWDANIGTFAGFARERIRYRLIDRLRYESRRRHVEPQPDNEPRSEPDFDTAQLIDVRRAIERLPQPQRLLLHLRFWRGLTMVEAARESGCSLDVAKHAQRAAIAELRSSLTPPPLSAAG